MPAQIAERRTIPRMRKQDPSIHSPKSDENQPPVGVVDPQQIVTDVINLLQAKDFPRLAAYAHPSDGVRLSPYGYVNTQTDVIMKPSVLQNALNENSVLKWGSYDGSGAPIELSFAEYYDQFIYDHDFVNADQVGYNTFISSGNSLNNASEVYPDSYIVEYLYEGTEANHFMDWASLKIVLVQFERNWVLAGIIHDQWTI